MGATSSKPAGEEGQIKAGAWQDRREIPPPEKQKHADGAACPFGFDGKSSEASTTASSDESAASAPAPTAQLTAAASEPSACPVSSRASATADKSSTSTSGCPVKKEDQGKAAKYLNPHKYNVYSQRIDDKEATAVGAGKTMDPSNNMPANPNQLPAPGQRQPLSTDRVQSTIPKGGDQNTWTYPSPQMFWNALSRKGKVDDTEEGDIGVVVAIHNNMNELTWKKILQWEKLRSEDDSATIGGGEKANGYEPRLLRFLGRPDDITPKALAKMVLGHPLPFDRHDWVVDRGGDERRYIIDYYHDEGVLDDDEVPELHSEGAVKSIKVDVRPALDSFSALAARAVQMPLARFMGKSSFAPLPLRPSPTMKAREPRVQPRTGGGLPEESTSQVPSRMATMQEPHQQQQDFVPTGTSGNALAGLSLSERDARAMARMKKKCVKQLMDLRQADEADDLTRAQAAALKLEYCTARYLCKGEARAYKEAVSQAESSTSIAGAEHRYWAENAVDRSMGRMRDALNTFATRQAEAAMAAAAAAVQSSEEAVERGDTP